MMKQIETLIPTVLIAFSVFVGCVCQTIAQGPYFLAMSTEQASDTTAPTPNPATFSSAPSATSSSAITMTATTGSDTSTPVEYHFDEISGNTGGTDSGWQESSTYTDSGLLDSNEYTYRVRMRDSEGNTGAYSSTSNATTDTQAAGSTYYVEPVTGSDSGDGSAGDPWLTLDHALSEVDDGPNTIKCEDGNVGPISVDRTGTDWIIIEPNDDSVYTVGGRSTIGNWSAQRDAYIQFKGAKFTNPGVNNSIVYLQGVSNVKFTNNCIFSNSDVDLDTVDVGDGIEIDDAVAGGSSDITVEDCDFYGLAYGISHDGTSGYSDGLAVTNCYMQDVQFGILFHGDNQSMTDTTIENVHEDAIRLLPCVVTIQDCNIGDANANVFAVPDDHHNDLVHVMHNGSGTWDDPNDFNVIIERTLFHDSVGQGVFTSTDNPGEYGPITLRNCLFYGNAGLDIQIFDCNLLTIEYCTGPVVGVRYGTYASLRNNIGVHIWAPTSDVHLAANEEGEETWFLHNDYNIWDKIPVTDQYYTHGSHSYSFRGVSVDADQNPNYKLLFTDFDNSDFTLTNSAPEISAIGFADPNYATAYDILEVSRPVGGTYDAGAYEYNP